MKFFYIILIIFFFNMANSFAEYPYFIDFSKVLNNSKAGKGAQDYLKKALQQNQKKFVNTEKELKKEESDLLEKKNILTKEEYAKKTDILRKKVIDYQASRRASVDKISRQRAEARQNLLKKIIQNGMLN